MESALPSPGDRRIVARGLRRSFGARTAVQPFEVDLGPGGVVGLLGPNGSGKSTLLRMLIGLVRPDAGEAWVDGVPLTGDGTAIRRRCSYAPGEIALYGEMRVDEHLRWLLRGRERDALARGRAMLDDFGLPRRSRVRTLSHGMKRQLAFAAALAPRMGVRILDEPTEGLDPSMRAALLDRLDAEASEGTTILLSSHHLGEVDRACHHLLFLNEGRLVASESAQSVHLRAARLLRLSWTAAIDMTSVGRALQAIAGSDVRVRDQSATVELEGNDPRAFLSRLFVDDGLPAPRTIEYGQISLHELYRDLYGVEGC